MSKQVNEIMKKKNRVKREPYDKIFLGKESVYYNKEMTFCLILETTILNLETMHVICAL